ncbi:UNVERIFIED_CONTAM: hypothetical protein K2H54_058267 [Gekko kuhli]
MTIKQTVASLKTGIMKPSSSDPCNRHLLLLANLVKEFHVLNHCVSWAVDTVMLVAEHRRDSRNVTSHKALHEFHQQVPAVIGYHTWTVFHLATETKAVKQPTITTQEAIRFLISTALKVEHSAATKNSSFL